MWFCLLPNLKLLTDYIINITAVSPGGSSSYLASFMLEEIGENSAHGDEHSVIGINSVMWYHTEVQTVSLLCHFCL